MVAPCLRSHVDLLTGVSSNDVAYARVDIYFPSRNSVMGRWGAWGWLVEKARVRDVAPLARVVLARDGDRGFFVHGRYWVLVRVVFLFR